MTNTVAVLNKAMSLLIHYNVESFIILRTHAMSDGNKPYQKKTKAG